MNLHPLINSSETLNNVSALFGRFGLTALFVLTGLSKIEFYDATAQYMASVGVPGMLLPLVILLEVVGGIMIIAGLLTRLTALAFALFSVVSALLFHFQLDDQTQFLMFYKNIAIAGGFLALAASGAGKFSLDALLSRRQAK
ncbi:DoxX family protein [Pseudoalteromonas sp. T1lg48]|uniref:DoxX family protein n=1 Tax=Pseudoalteromonas sp. T1lg48 TaxID=2077100 RepID=UPI000CF73A08|nr:DoxX family protein [Pseudoalteromonas sp. T1lg48]